ANIVSGALAIVVWPLGCLALARQVFGPSRAALAVTGVLSVGFGAFPWGLLGFGVLWANTLGLVLVPATLAVLLSLVGLAKENAVGKVRAGVLLLVGMGAIGLSNPGALFSFFALAVPVILAASLIRAWRLRADGKTGRGIGEFVIVFGVIVGTWYWTATTSNPTLANTRNTYWAPFETPSRAIGEILLNATNGRPALWLISFLMLVGIVLCVRSAMLRWVIAAHAVSGFLYLVAAAFNRPDTQKFTGYWYNDSYRLAAMLPITGTLLATAGVLFLASKIADWRTADETAGEAHATPTRPAWLRRVTPTVAAVAIAGLLVVLTSGMYVPDRTARLTQYYQTPPVSNTLADDEQLAFFERVKAKIPEGAVVANNPWDGSGLLWAVADRRTLFPHFTLPANSDRAYLAEHLDNVEDDPKVCRAANSLKVRYLLIGDSEFWPWDGRNKDYPGFKDPGTTDGFELIDSDGDAKLYLITGCGTS
ncbi:MAG: hypothetical protein M3548_07865, partial [Actinomycetota bacterium]|nr:hypothetical protein [Actinomycetota bacterium]